MKVGNAHNTPVLMLFCGVFQGAIVSVLKIAYRPYGTGER